MDVHEKVHREWGRRGWGHMLDQCLSTGKRTGRAVEVFFIHTFAKTKQKKD